MIEAVVDASVVIKWWRTDGETDLEEARELRAAFEIGELSVIVPRLLFVEILNAFGRRWGWPEQALHDLARALDASRFDVDEPDLESIARWVARGLTAYDASYVAVAETRGVDLVTADEAILSAAPDIARPLAG